MSNFLTNVKIDKLFNEKNIDWSLNGNVNVLVGKNGTGKTNILNIIYQFLDFLCSKDLTETAYYSFNKYHGIELKFINELECKVDSSALLNEFKTIEDKFISYRKDINSHLLHLQKSYNTIKKAQSNHEFAKKINLDDALAYIENFFDERSEDIKQMDSDIESISTLKLNYLNRYVKHNIYQDKIRLNSNELKNILDKIVPVYISSPDALVSSSNTDNIDGNQRSQLDIQISENLLKINTLKNKDILLAKIEHSINSFFNDVGKTIKFLIDDNLITVTTILNSDEKYNTTLKGYSDYSSGEKHLLYIFTKLAFEMKQDKTTILIIDEPEISMHLSWQDIFIAKLIEFNPNMQIIMATHSPALLMNGWMNNYIEIDNITSY